MKQCNTDIQNVRSDFALQLVEIQHIHFDLDNDIFRSLNTKCQHTTPLKHSHLQRGEQSKLALAQLQAEQLPLHEHLINARHDFETSGIVIQTDSHFSEALVQPDFSGEGISGLDWVLVVHIPA